MYQLLKRIEKNCTEVPNKKKYDKKTLKISNQ